MRKVFKTACLILATLIGTGTALAGEAFEYEYNFDTSTDLPEGWLVEGDHFKVGPAAANGLTAQSGDNVIAAEFSQSTDVIYTPMISLAAGVPCRMDFYVINPNALVSAYAYSIVVDARDGQSGEAVSHNVLSVPNGDRKTWTKLSVSFTPEADGEYCFAIKAASFNDASASVAKEIAFDSFTISGQHGDAPTPGPGPDEPTEGEAFENEYNFDASTDLPDGWLVEGSKLRINTPDYWGLGAAQSGDNALGATSISSADAIYTPLIKLASGKECTLEFFVKAPEAYNGIAGWAYEIDVTAGTAQESSAQTLKLEHRASQIYSDWTKISVAFTPEATAEYCFCIKAKNAMTDTFAKAIAFDTFFISGTKAEGGDEPGPGPDPITPGEGDAFENEYNFDASDDLPEGWLAEGNIKVESAADYFGYMAQSGDNVLGASKIAKGQAVYTPLLPLVGGKECTLEFYVYAPEAAYDNVAFAYTLDVTAGQGQTVTDQTIQVKHCNPAIYKDWTKITGSFTPEKDGEYSFAINAFVANGDTYGRTILFDTFFISGTKPKAEDPDPIPDFTVLEPNEDNLAECVELPYFEKFDGENYDGSSYLPIGWLTTGTKGFVTASAPGLTAVSGDYYMITEHNSDAERDDKAYTCYFNLTEGTEYTIDFKYFIQGNDWNLDDILYLPTLTFTVGTEQESDFHVDIKKISERTTEWKQETIKFTPLKSGAYCFAFMLTGPTNSGMVAVEDFSITAEGLVARVEPAFVIKGVYSLYDERKTVVFEETPVQMVNLSDYATSYKWTCEGAVPSESEEENPSFTFPADGEYNIVLEAINSRGSRSTAHKINVQALKNDQQYPLNHYSSSQDKLFNRGETPAFASDTEGDYVTGFNHYYYDVAQRFDFSTARPVNIRQITFNVTERRYRNMTALLDDQRIKPLTIAFYGSTPEGELDEDNLLGKIETTVGEALGSSGLGGTAMDYKDVEFETPVRAEGTFYVALHFDKGLEVEPSDASLGRSYIGTQVMKHGHGQTTLYCKPYAVPEGSGAELNKWQTIDRLDFRKAGLGAFWSLWCTPFDPTGVGSVSVADKGEFAASFVGDELSVEGTAEGETVMVFNLSGACVATASAAEGMSTIALPGLQSGIYVVKCGNRSTKAVK